MQLETVYHETPLLFPDSPPKLQLTENIASASPAAFCHPPVKDKRYRRIPLLFLIQCHGIARRLVDHPEWIGPRKFAPPTGRTAKQLIAGKKKKNGRVSQIDKKTLKMMAE